MLSYVTKSPCHKCSGSKRKTGLNVHTVSSSGKHCAGGMGFRGPDAPRRVTPLRLNPPVPNLLGALGAHRLHGKDASPLLWHGCMALPHNPTRVSMGCTQQVPSPSSPIFCFCLPTVFQDCPHRIISLQYKKIWSKGQGK